MQVTLLGTGDTTGTPTPGCDCETCQAARERGIERTRFSVHVEDESTGDTLLIDFSPDFRHQFLREDVPLPDAGVVTHVHFDHVDGLGNANRLFDDLPVYAANETDPNSGESVAAAVARKFDYLDALDARGVTPHETFEAAGFDVTLVPVDHPPLLCYGVVVESDGAKLVLSGDTTYDVPEQSRDAMRDADLLLADGIVPASLCEYHPKGGKHEGPDGTYRTFGTKHMTREGALALGNDLDASETRVVHAAHFYPEEEAFAPEIAVDGETFCL